MKNSSQTHFDVFLINNYTLKGENDEKEIVPSPDGKWFNKKEEKKNFRQVQVMLGQERSFEPKLFVSTR